MANSIAENIIAIETYNIKKCRARFAACRVTIATGNMRH
jgi:hypothetical protein